MNSIGTFVRAIANAKFSELSTQSQSQHFLLRKKIYIEHQNILTAIHDQDWSFNLPLRSIQGRPLLDPFNINYTVISYAARGRVGRVTDYWVRGLGFKSPGWIITSRTETSSLSRVVRDAWDQSSVPISG